MGTAESQKTFIVRVLYLAFWVALFYGLLRYVLPLLVPFVIAFLLAFLLKRPIRFLERKTPLGPKAAAVIVLVLTFAIVGTAIAFLSIWLVTSAGNGLMALPRLYVQYIAPAIENVSDWLGEVAGTADPLLSGFIEAAAESVAVSISGLAGDVSAWAVGLVAGAVSGVPWALLGFLLTVVSSFYFVVDYRRITVLLTRRLPSSARRKLFIIKDFAVNILLRFGRSYLLIMAITYAEIAIGLLILRVPNPFILALFIVIVDVLPVLGTGTVMLPWAIYNFVSGNWPFGISLLVLYAVMTVVRQVIEPRIIGRNIGLYPLLTLICMFVGVRLFGLWGLFGFPFILVILVHLYKAGELAFFHKPAAGKPNDTKGEQ